MDSLLSFIGFLITIAVCLVASSVLIYFMIQLIAFVAAGTLAGGLLLICLALFSRYMGD